MADDDQVNRSAAAPPCFTVDGNALTPLTSGSERLAALLGLIEGARRSLRLLYYIYVDDEAGARMRAALAAALARGVDVRLIVDGFGSSLPADYFAELSGAGADVCRFLPRYGRRYLLRNHQKLALADERIAMIGGFNISRDYFDDETGWRDLGLIVQGPAAERLVGYFDALATWTHQEKARLRDLRRALSTWSEPKGGPVRWLLGGPTRRLSPWAVTVKREMEHARSLRLIAAYFAPSPRMMRRIEGVKRRGGEARVVTPAKTDHMAAVAAARHYLRAPASARRRHLRISAHQAAHEIVRDRRHRPCRLRQFRHAQHVPQPRADAAGRGSRLRRAHARLFRGGGRRQPRDHAGGARQGGVDRAATLEPRLLHHGRAGRERDAAAQLRRRTGLTSNPSTDVPRLRSTVHRIAQERAPWRFVVLPPPDERANHRSGPWTNSNNNAGSNNAGNNNAGRDAGQQQDRNQQADRQQNQQGRDQAAGGGNDSGRDTQAGKAGQGDQAGQANGNR